MRYLPSFSKSRTRSSVDKTSPTQRGSPTKRDNVVNVENPTPVNGGGNKETRGFHASKSVPVATSHDQTAPRRASTASLIDPLPGIGEAGGRFHVARSLDIDYDVQSQVLGSGLAGAVKLCVGKHDGKPYALKSVKISRENPRKLDMVRNEARIFLRLDHPNVCRLFDVYEEQNFVHFVMQYCSGKELFDRLHDVRRYTEANAARAVEEMLLALGYLHGRNIAHRDVKLENFVYENPSETAHLKLIDFGFAKRWDASHKLKSSCGSTSYVAPEVASGGPSGYTSQCDMWSLGVVTFMLLSGTAPFGGPSLEVLRKVRAGNFVMRPERWSNVSAPAVDFVKGLLQVDPALRMTAEQAVAHPWIAPYDHHHVTNDELVGVVNSLRRFAQASRFERVALTMLAWSLQEQDCEAVHEVFLEFDKTHSGTISAQDLLSLAKQYQMTPQEADAILDALDSHHDGHIHYSDFLAAMIRTRIALNDSSLRATFHRFDEDDSGKITLENLKSVLGDELAAQEVLAEAGVADGISFDEFRAALLGHGAPGDLLPPNQLCEVA